MLLPNNIEKFSMLRRIKLCSSYSYRRTNQSETKLSRARTTLFCKRTKNPGFLESQGTELPSVMSWRVARNQVTSCSGLPRDRFDLKSSRLARAAMNRFSADCARSRHPPMFAFPRTRSPVSEKER